jgi:hypothetical protein
MPLVYVVDVADRGRRWWHEGVWGVVVRVVEEEEACTVVFDCQVTIRPGVDDGGKRSGAALVRLHGRQRQAGEGGGGGAAPRREGHDDDDDDGYATGEWGGRGRWRGRGKKGKRFV